jgi:3-methyladenine DNA glycosylase Tag
MIKKYNKNMSTPTTPRFSISPYFAAYDPAKPTPVITKTVERLLADAGIVFQKNK